MAKDWLAKLLGNLADRQVDLDVVLRRIVDETTRRLDADRGTLYLVDHATRELVSRVAHLPEIAEIRLRIGEGVAGWVADEAQAVRIARDEQDARHSVRFDAMTGYRTDSMLAVPLLRDGVVLGVLQLLNQRTGRFSEADEAALARIGEQVVRILDGTSLRSQLQPDNPRPLAFRFNHIVGESASMQAVYARVARAAPKDVTVLVRGETGTGKELIARAVHHNSARRDGPLVKVDCAALPESLIENELFGHEKGAFTGADRRTEGKVHAADGGTLFLDEIGELTLPVQGKLLRLLQDKRFLRVGGTVPEPADVRFVCATHVDLERRVAEGTFRRDLYYRLRVVEIVMPPLRARGHGDLDRLVDHFLFEFCRRHKRDVTLSTGARNALHSWPWPGNVRELEHCLESAVVLCPASVIEVGHLPLGDDTLPESVDVFTSDLRPLEAVERDYVRWALELHDGNRSATAAALGIGRNTLLRKLKGD
ncbi:MAG: sigma 54-interacting transcriptional regulator [Alphaproteobacteria bacterium]|nr:sigma 54-interacting transcriptional regulator [Alphaproteobacteria bacterium]